MDIDNVDSENSKYLRSKNFLFGTAIAAAQNEGNPSTRGQSVWDAFAEIPGNIKDGSNGSVACDFYNRYKEDIQLMKKLGYKNLRLSISWCRILPDGETISEEGIKFYNDLFNELLDNGIEPCVTLNHWDMPQCLFSSYKGWLDKKAIKDFINYAKICFKSFQQIKFWLTHNEPWCIMISYTTGEQAPGYREAPGYAPYIVAHNLLLSHAYTVKHYRKYYSGKIGICLNTNWWAPITTHPVDVDASNRALQFMFGLFYEPIMLGDYPAVVKEIVGERLPVFTEEQKKVVKGSTDFTGINYYTSIIVVKQLLFVLYRMFIDS